MSDSLWERLGARAAEIHVADHLGHRLARGEKLRVKFGMDPTAPDLHVGHLVPLDVLRDFQSEGHTVVLIVGDFTAQIGDPSGKSETRPVLSREQVDANARTYFEQLALAVDPGQAEIRGNAEWLEEMEMADVLRLLGKATLQQVLQREDFAERVKSGSAIGAHEILYPFNQAYDSVAIRADVEIGGTDQLFNLLFGREIQRAYGQEPQDVIVFPLLEGLDGVQKMSKSLGNYIGLAEPPEQIYGKLMSIPDALTPKYLRLVSGMNAGEVERTLALPPRQAKAVLARALVRRLHGEEAAGLAEDHFGARFVRREIDPATLPAVRVPEAATVADTLITAGFFPSFSQLRKAVEAGSVRLNGAKVQRPDAMVKNGDVIDVGKVRRAVRVEVGG